MRSFAAVPAAALLLVTAACSSDDNGAAAAPTATASPEASSTAPSVTQVRVVSAGAAYYFQAPSGNIHCEMARDRASCDIGDPMYEQPAKPSDCEFDYGINIAVEGEARAEFGCVSDTAAAADNPVLAYGESVSNGSVTCASATSGVTCSTSGGSHGFDLSRASYRLY